MAKKKLDQKKLEYYKNILLKMKYDLIHDVKNMSDTSRASSTDSGDVSGHVLHMADVATDMYDKEFTMGLASKDRKILQRIENALKRLEDKAYGFCLGTGKAITQARLKALPYAEYCLKYQEEIESKTEG